MEYITYFGENRFGDKFEECIYSICACVFFCYFIFAVVLRSPVVAIGRLCVAFYLCGISRKRQLKCSQDIGTHNGWNGRCQTKAYRLCQIIIQPLQPVAHSVDTLKCRSGFGALKIVSNNIIINVNRLRKFASHLMWITLTMANDAILSLCSFVLYFIYFVILFISCLLFFVRSFEEFS